MMFKKIRASYNVSIKIVILILENILILLPLAMDL